MLFAERKPGRRTRPKEKCSQCKPSTAIPVSHQYANGDEELELRVESTAQVEGGQLRQEQGANLDCYAHTCRHKRTHTMSIPL
jgi:hypothetical protein